MVNYVWPRIYLVSFSWNGRSYHIYSNAFALSQALVHSLVGQCCCIRDHPLQPVALTRCRSVVIFILLKHWPSRLIALQYGRSTSSSVSRLVTIPVRAFGRGLLIILLFNSNLKSFSHDLGRYAQSWSHGSCLNCLSWCHSVTVARAAVW